MKELDYLCHLNRVQQRYFSMPRISKLWVRDQILLYKKGVLPKHRLDILKELPDFGDYLKTLDFKFKIGFWLENYKFVLKYCKKYKIGYHTSNFHHMGHRDKQRIMHWHYNTLSARKSKDAGKSKIFFDLFDALPAYVPPPPKEKFILHPKDFYISMVNRISLMLNPRQCCGLPLISREKNRPWVLRCQKCHKQSSVYSGTPFAHMKTGGYKTGALIYEMSIHNSLDIRKNNVDYSPLLLTPWAIYRNQKKFGKLLTTHKVKIKKIIAEESKKWGIKR